MSKKLVTAAALADELQITPGRVRQLVDAGVLPREGRNAYHLAGCRKAYSEFKKAAAGGDESEYLRYLKLKNDLLENENRIKRGDLISRDDYMGAAMQSVAACRSRLLSIPSKAAPLLVGSDDKHARKMLNRFVDEALRELKVPDFKRIARDRQKEKRKA